MRTASVRCRKNSPQHNRVQRTHRLLPLPPASSKFVNLLVPHARPVQAARIARELVERLDVAMALLLDVFPRLFVG